MPPASFTLYASAALRRYAPTEQNEPKRQNGPARQLLGSTFAFLGCARVRSAHPRWTCRVQGLIRDPVDPQQVAAVYWVQLVSSHKSVRGTGRVFCSYLSDLLPQHGGTGVDDKHNVLGNGRQVFGGEVVDKVSV